MVRSILLADDEEGIRKVLSIYLKDEGYKVFTAKDGEETLRVFRKEHPPIVLTDIKMPVVDGLQVLEKIKQESPDTEVIMLTGHGDLELAIKSLKLDATDFITKPISDDVLEIALKRAKERIFYKTKLREYTENLEKLVEEKTKKLVESERLAAVGQTVAGLAHAIKNLTSGLKGGVYVVEKGIELDNNEYLSRGWDMVKTDVGRITNLALDLLSYAKEREPDYALCDPNKIACEVFDLMVSRAREYGIQLIKDLDESIPDVWIDPEGIHRCLLNLVTNAIDACTDIECSGKDGQVILRSKKSQGWDVEYQVEDTGCGMDEDTKSKIFQWFFSTKGSKGTGLGLMLTKKIVDEHGGTIDLESEKGKGSKFVIKLVDKRRKSAVSGQ